jgi:hypothetical protein
MTASVPLTGADKAPATLFISAYRSVSVRYILYSDVFQELKAKGLRIVLFLKDKDLEYYRGLFEDRNVSVEPILFDRAMRTLRKNRLNRMLSLIRRCMSGSRDGIENTTNQVYLFLHGREMGSNFKSRAAFRLVRLAAALCRKHVMLRKGLLALESIASPGRLYDPYFRKYRPDILLVSSIGYMIDPFFMRAARRHRCKVVSIIHNWDNPTTKDYRGAAPDHVIVWNEIMKQEIVAFHDIPEDKVHIGGIAHWDIYFNASFHPRPKRDFLDAYQLKKDRKLLLYGTSSYMIFRQTFDVIEALLAAAAGDRFVQPVQLMVRLHPAYFITDHWGGGQVIGHYQERIERLYRSYPGLIVFAHPQVRILNDDIDMPKEDMYLLAEKLHYADILLTEYSTLCIEGAIFDLPVVNAALYHFRDTEKPISYLETFTHIQRLLSYKASRNARSFDQLVHDINAYLEDPAMDRENRRRLVASEVTHHPGCAGVRIAEFIGGLAALERARKLGGPPPVRAAVGR